MTVPHREPERSAEKPAEQRCRTCGAPVSDTAETLPFCSKRCQLADLGRWFNGEYRISRDVKDSDIYTVD